MNNYQRCVLAGMKVSGAPAVARMYENICVTPGISINAASGGTQDGNRLERARKLEDAGLIRIEGGGHSYACYPVEEP